MGEFQAMDILILAAVAGFLIYRLYNVLGEDDGSRGEKNKDKNIGNIVKFPPNELKSIKKETKAEPITKKVIKVYPDFEMESFLIGAEKAFEFIIDSFDKGNKETLKTLLGQNLYESFSKSIDKRNKNKEILEQRIEAISEIKAESVEIKGDDVYITVKFVSEQIIALFANDGKILKGKTDQVEKHEDLWTFHRKAGDSSPIWKLVTTKQIS